MTDDWKNHGWKPECKGCRHFRRSGFVKGCRNPKYQKLDPARKRVFWREGETCTWREEKEKPIPEAPR